MKKLLDPWKNQNTTFQREKGLMKIVITNLNLVSMIINWGRKMIWFLVSWVKVINGRMKIRMEEFQPRSAKEIILSTKRGNDFYRNRHENF